MASTARRTARAGVGRRDPVGLPAGIALLWAGFRAFGDARGRRSRRPAGELRPRSAVRSRFGGRTIRSIGLWCTQWVGCRRSLFGRDRASGRCTVRGLFRRGTRCRTLLGCGRIRCAGRRSGSRIGSCCRARPFARYVWSGAVRRRRRCRGARSLGSALRARCLLALRWAFDPARRCRRRFEPGRGCLLGRGCCRPIALRRWGIGQRRTALRRCRRRRRLFRSRSGQPGRRTTGLRGPLDRGVCRWNGLGRPLRGSLRRGSGLGRALGGSLRGSGRRVRRGRRGLRRRVRQGGRRR